MPASAPPPLVAMLDSGIFPEHPHLQGLDYRGLDLQGLAPPFRLGEDVADRTGHGTAAAAALHRLAPELPLLIVRLLDAELRTSSAALAEGIRLAARRGARIINLSLGSRAPEAREILADAVDEARAAGAICVAAAHPRGAGLWPADLPSVLSAATHRACPLADLYAVEGPLPRFVLHGWPRPIEGRPATDNLFGTSFAAVHLAARVAALLSADAGLDFAAVVAGLRASALGPWMAA